MEKNCQGQKRPEEPKGSPSKTNVKLLEKTWSFGRNWASVELHKTVLIPWRWQNRQIDIVVEELTKNHMPPKNNDDRFLFADMTKTLRKVGILQREYLQEKLGRIKYTRFI